MVQHFWREYEGFHNLSDLPAWRRHLQRYRFVEPSVGAGVFLFGLLEHLARRGASVEDIALLKFAGVDLNAAALEFVRRQLALLVSKAGFDLAGVTLHLGDFLSFEASPSDCVSYVGNPPYVRNPAGSRWRNIYADFIERMLDAPTKARALSLIVPLSVAFSRDYAQLRSRMDPMVGLRLEAFDNIPDCLFSAGKPGNSNTNKANSQRCVILSAREDGARLRQATELRRWSRGMRRSALESGPLYHDFVDYNFDDQWPRPSSDWILPYLSAAHAAPRVRDLVAPGPYGLGVASVARNFIGLRDLQPRAGAGSIQLTFATERDFAVAFQILASPIFYEWWRSVGDGFHVTRSDVLSFPILPRLRSACLARTAFAIAGWKNRSMFERSKLNAGREVRSYDFRGLFDGLLETVIVQSLAAPEVKVRAA